MDETLSMTKNEMARRIVKVLYNMPHLPVADSPIVKGVQQRHTAVTLRRQLKLALAAEVSTKGAR